MPLVCQNTEPDCCAVTGPEGGDAGTYQGNRARGLVTGHEKQVYAVAFSPDGKTLATGSEDLTARFWDAATG